MAVYNDVVDKAGLNRFYTNLQAIGLPLNDWAANTSYKVGLIVVYQGTLYRCNAAHTSATTFDSTKFDPISLDVAPGVPLLSWSTNTAYSVGDLVYYSGSIYECNTAHTSDATSFSNDTTNWDRISGDTVTIATNNDIDSLF